jgi:hypothetical protein
MAGRDGRRTVLALIDAFMKIALRRLGPEDLPDSSLLLGIVLVAYAVLQAGVALPVYGGISGELLGSLVVEVGLLAGYTWAVLFLAGHRDRYQRTLTALLGTGALLTLVMLPAFLWARASGAAGGVAVLPGLAVVAVLVWLVATNGHILARALSVEYPLGVAAALGHLVLNFLVAWSLGFGT